MSRTAIRGGPRVTAVALALAILSTGCKHTTKTNAATLRRSAAADQKTCLDAVALGFASWEGASTSGFTTKSGTKVAVTNAYPSTVKSMNGWNIGGQQVEVLTNEWPDLPPSTHVTACWLSGIFSTTRGETFTIALVEVAKGKSRLVVAGSKQHPLRIASPPAE